MFFLTVYFFYHVFLIIPSSAYYQTHTHTYGSDSSGLYITGVLCVCACVSFLFGCVVNSVFVVVLLWMYESIVRFNEITVGNIAIAGWVRIKLSFHLCIIWMQMLNANDECDKGTSLVFPPCDMCYFAVVLRMRGFHIQLSILHSLIHFVDVAVCIHILMYGSTSIEGLLLLCFCFIGSHSHTPFALCTNGISALHEIGKWSLHLISLFR